MAAGKKTGGRKKGVPNKVTADARAAIATFIEGNIGRLQTWLNEIADGKEDAQGNYIVRPNPEKAFQLFVTLLEYHVPKLARNHIEHGDKQTLSEWLASLD